ncbi:Dihydropteroate synthase, DHPS [Oceanicola granulosus HTCC2516]|uniref:Dihydropteroate synthase n=1 Tax=Oceanicola granulosus (strain ATCC BAA-861 / DSM 15982 / KCTC 12143 / HTCC2516) TaxID=314256 RepID=Q2CBF5_OCEGH|nr:dihydropteroate synthase [Oceanicola granulosus]EAR50008.1 Dihydropteroate synthase, DHPS [Oceanicola granulosus HTCC2516]
MIPRPIATTGPGLPLAGSRSARFVGTEGGDLSDADRDRLTALRPPIAGLSLERPRVMGILNVTPDSFSDGGDLGGVVGAVARARAMALEADILDIGGESTRPGAEEVAVDEEIARTAPVIRAIREAGITTPISIDTRKAPVAEAALDAGADIVNDVTALRFDPDMAGLVAARQVPVCLMHSVADPKTMQAHARYDDVVTAVFDHLAERISAAEAAGIPRELLIVDPGIGFGKTLQHNLSLLRALALYHALGPALLVGASRKRFIGEIAGADAAKDRTAGSVAVALHAAAHGAQILRVHDTYETRQALALHLAMNEDGT